MKRHMLGSMTNVVNKIITLGLTLWIRNLIIAVGMSCAKYKHKSHIFNQLCSLQLVYTEK